MAKKAKKAAAAPAQTGADGQPVDPNDTGSSNSSSALGDVGSTISNAISGAAGAVASPFGNWLNSIEADVMNASNQVFNTLFFGLCVALGALGIVWGLYLLFKDTAPVQGAKKVVESAAMVAAL